MRHKVQQANELRHMVKDVNLGAKESGVLPLRTGHQSLSEEDIQRDKFIIEVVKITLN